MLEITKEYKVLDEMAKYIELGKEEGEAYLDCVLYNNDIKMIAQYRYFTKEEIEELTKTE